MWVERLAPQVQNAIHRRLHDGQGAVRARLAYTDALGRSLVRLSDLDALACLLLYWGESMTSTDRDTRTHPAIRIYQLLQILGMDFMRRGLLDDIFCVFRARVFDRAVNEYGRLCVDGTHYQASTRALHLLRTKTPEAPAHAAWATQVRVMLRLLEGDKGFDARYALAPRWTPDWQVGPPSRETLAQWARDSRLRAWGWSHLKAGTIGKFPPQDLL